MRIRENDFQLLSSRRMGLACTGLLFLTFSGCSSMNPNTEPSVEGDTNAEVVIDRSLKREDIDPKIYSLLDDPNDPFAAVYERFRTKRESDMNDPEKPPPIEPFAAAHPSQNEPWDEIDAVLPFDWAAVRQGSPEEAEQLVDAIKVRVVLSHPDIKITQLMLGPGATLPSHAGGSPGFFHVIGGEGEVTVEGATQQVTPGTTVKLNPYDVRRVHATSSDPLKVLWIRWAPDGDQRYIAAGYYLTGANMHVQPKEATLETPFLFWGEAGNTSPLPDPSAAAIADRNGASLFTTQQAALERVRAQLRDERDPYPDTPRFSDENDVPWMSAELLEGSGFFWAKDIASLGDLAQRWSEVFRLKGFFRAVRPDGGWDFNISMMAWGPHAFYVEHSHSIPEFYYMMSGPVEHWVDGQKYIAMPGDVYVTNSYTAHQSRGIVDDMPFRSIGASWPPNGRREVFERPFFLVEPLPDQPASASLGPAPSFHD